MPQFRTPDGLRLHYLDHGKGPAVLALSGLTRTTRDFDYAAPHLRCRLIRMDYRGRGASDRADPATYTIPQEAADALALLDHLGLERAAILGTSRGGLIAMALTQIAPRRLSGACLVDIGPEVAAEGIAAILAYLGRPPAARTWAEAAAERPTLLPGFRNVPATRWDREVRIHYRETPDGLAITYDPRLRDGVLAMLDRPAPDAWPMFVDLPRPLAALRGANSNLLSRKTWAEMRRRRPDMILSLIHI